MKRKKETQHNTTQPMQYNMIWKIAATNNIDNIKGIKENSRNEKSIVSGESNLVYLVEV